MRFMLLVKANQNSEAGKLPSEEMFADMGKFNDEMMKAGILLDLSGLKPTSQGARVRFTNGTTVVTDGPFPETKDLVAGYWLINVKSKEEAIDWARRVPFCGEENDGSEIEIRPLYELEDFLPSDAVDRARERRNQLAANKR